MLPLKKGPPKYCPVIYLRKIYSYIIAIYITEVAMII